MCTMSSSGRKLQTAEQHAAVLYTLDMGPLPVYTVHLRCHSAYVAVAARPWCSLPTRM